MHDNAHERIKKLLIIFISNVFFLKIEILNLKNDVKNLIDSQ